MQTRSHQPWGVRLGTLAIWALAAASAAYWGLRLTARPPGMPAPTAAPAPVAADMQAMARLLGAVTAQTPQAAAAVVIDPSDLNADLHASAAYRANLISVQTQRAVAKMTGA